MIYVVIIFAWAAELSGILHMPDRGVLIAITGFGAVVFAIDAISEIPHWLEQRSKVRESKRYWRSMERIYGKEALDEYAQTWDWNALQAKAMERMEKASRE